MAESTCFFCYTKLHLLFSLNYPNICMYFYYGMFVYTFLPASLCININFFHFRFLMFLFDKICLSPAKVSCQSSCPLFQDESDFSLSRKRNFHLVSHELLCVWVFCSAKASITSIFCESSFSPGWDIGVLYQNVHNLNHWITSNPVTFCCWSIKGTEAVDILAQFHSVPLKFLPDCSVCFPEWWEWF